MPLALPPNINSLLVHRRFVWMWLAMAQSQFGTLLNLVALSLFIFEKTKSGLAVGTPEIAMAIPTALIGLLAGVIVDRCNRKKVMVVSDIIRGLLFLTIGLIAETHIIYGIVFLASLVGLFYGPPISLFFPKSLIKID